MRKWPYWLFSIILLFIFVPFVFSAPTSYGNIKDDNNGEVGDILINTGKDSGGSDIGTWTNIKDIPELKGDKGDKGEQGIAGKDGIDGINGIDGYTPVKGVDYFDGANGIDGKDGYNPIKGVDYFDGKDGQDGINGKDGLDGVDGKDGQDVDPQTVLDLQSKDISLKDDISKESLERLDGDNLLKKDISAIDLLQTKWNKNQDSTLRSHNDRLNGLEKRTNRLEETQVNIDTELQFIRDKNLTVGLYGKYDVRHNRVPEVGVRVVIGIGKSWTERQIDKVTSELQQQREEQLNTLATVKELEARVNYLSRKK